MNFTGERFVPELKGQISYEHLHRYAIAARFCAGKRVLDIASGEGYGSALLARTAQQVVGVDNDEEAVEHARRSYYLTNLRFVQGSCTQIPLGDASVDVVAAFETIEHVDEHERMLDELRRVLVPGGVLILSSPNKLVYSDLPGFRNPFHVKELYFADLRDLLTRRFRHVAFYGQRLGASSIVHPLSGGASEGATWYNGGVTGLSPGLPSLGNPVYFVAVCSDEPLAFDLSSAYLDAADDLLDDIWRELNELRGRRLALAAAPQAALPAGEGDEDAVAANALEDDLARGADAAEHARHEIDELRAGVAGARKAAAEVSIELLDERAKNERVTQQLAELRALRASARAADAAELETYAQLRSQVVALTEALQRAEADGRLLREVLSSRSWKLTTPLRRAAALLRRGDVS
jgi:SAM-dependent methyltransferase